ncbi:hypothetical protein [Microbulbifer epialgicus]|uniref:Uncharacterized protein n=1 Tax=Microbulbifer epialgicus TaxID=393907 RepID=A0ABV4P7L9_9GAMM
MRKLYDIDSIRCFKCGEEYFFPHGPGRVYYYSLVEIESSMDRLEYKDLISVIIKPVWCFDCEAASVAEDIPTIREFEHTYKAVSDGVEIEVPFCSSNIPVKESQEILKSYISWKMNRVAGEKCLHCGGANFLTITEEMNLIHDSCEDGVFCHRLAARGPFNGPIYARVYSADGEFKLEGNANYSHVSVNK